MTFRDDHDAALARAAALEAENERLREENERLKNPEPEPEPAPEPPKRAPTSPSTWPPEWLGLAAKIGAGVLLFLALLWYGVTHDPDRAESRRNDKIRARNAYQQRWHTLVWVEPCLRSAEDNLRWGMQYTPDKHDPRADRGYVDMRTQADRIGGSCVREATAASVDPSLSLEARRALSTWAAADRKLGVTADRLAEYYGERDWVEDDFAGGRAMWEDVVEALEPWLAARDEVERLALPQLRREIVTLAEAHEAKAGRDDTWWRIHIGLVVWDLLAAGHAAMRDSERGGAVDARWVAAACRETATKILVLGRDAPLEVRRDLRDFTSYLEALAAGVAGDTAETMSHIQYTPRDLILSIDTEAIPGMPPEPT